MLARALPQESTGRLPNPERTRKVLLPSTYREIYRSGFGSAGLDTILTTIGITKGALFQQFGSKEALGCAIVEPSVRSEDVRYGCPLNNLAQEMPPLDAHFRKRLARIFNDWQKGIASALLKGQAEGTVRSDLDARETANFLIAMYEGYLSLAKNGQDVNLLRVGIRSVIRWLRSLRATNEHPHLEQT